MILFYPPYGEKICMVKKYHFVIRKKIVFVLRDISNIKVINNLETRVSVKICYISN
jgi:hypothetical protein